MDKTQIFIDKARKVHGDKYDYSLVNYIHSKQKVKIIHPEFGEFEQTPNSHLMGRGHVKEGLRKIYNKRAMGLEEFIRRAREVHGNKYDYSLVEYKNSGIKVKIICEKHGVFEISPLHHIYSGVGCKKCSYESTRRIHFDSNEEFIQIAVEIHGDKYDYSLVDYVNNYTPVKIICKKHGEFEQTPFAHIIKMSGCNKCAAENRRITKDQFIERSNKMHGGKYDYSDIIYTKLTDKVKNIKCPHHGYFDQLGHSHSLLGKGCQKCAVIDSKLENFIEEYLIKNDIYFIRRDRNTIKPKELDFYLPLHDIAIECNGVYWHSEKNNVGNDYHLNKSNLCDELGINLLHFNEEEFIYNKKFISATLNNFLNCNQYHISTEKISISHIFDFDFIYKFFNTYSNIKVDNTFKYTALYYKGRVVALIGYKDIDGYTEIIFSNISIYNILECFNILFEYIKNNICFNRIIMNIDKRINYSKLFKDFTINGHIQPTYKYFKNGKLKLYDLNELGVVDNFDKDLNEWDNMKSMGYNRIWDCGRVVMEYYGL